MQILSFYFLKMIRILTIYTRITVQIYLLMRLRSFCKSCWHHKHNFVTIDLSSERCRGKYRMNFNMFYIPETLRSSTSNVERERKIDFDVKYNVKYTTFEKYTTFYVER